MEATEERVEQIKPEQMSLDALGSMERAHVCLQVETAKKYPRSIRQFKQDAMALACLDEETAAGCFFSLPRGSKPIEGPSVRLAEIVASSWGHMRVQARVIEEAEKHVTAQGVCWDLQNNVAVSVEVRRRITDKNGRRYNDDMVLMTQNAACAIALRNAVFKVVPAALFRPVYLAARALAIGDAEGLTAKRAKLIGYFGKMGVKPQQIFDLLGVKGEEDISLDHLGTMHGLATALKDGDTTVDQAFPPAVKPGAPAGDLKERMKEKAAGGEAKPAEAKPVPEQARVDDPTAEAELRAMLVDKGTVQLPELEKRVKRARELLNAEGLAATLRACRMESIQELKNASVGTLRAFLEEAVFAFMDQ